MNSKYFQTIFLILFLLAVHSVGFSQEKKFIKNGHFYFSWGYNTESYSKSDIHIVQPSLHNDYVFNNTLAHDHIGWNELFQHDLTIPQYNYRLGYFFNEKQTWGIELNFDHTKYVVTSGQTVHVTGIMNDSPIDMNVITGDSVLRYQLNNGANFFLLNLVRRINIFTSSSKKFQVDALLKGGIGPVIPHVQNTIFGKDNVPHFQFGGWNTGIEITIKATFFKFIYLEFCDKGDYARYSNLKVYEGTAAQSFFTHELILNLGITFPLGKKEIISDKK